MTRPEARRQVVNLLEELLPRLRADEPGAWEREVYAASPWDIAPRALEQALAYMLLGTFLERWRVTVDAQCWAILRRDGAKPEVPIEVALLDHVLTLGEPTDRAWRFWLPIFQRVGPVPLAAADEPKWRGLHDAVVAYDIAIGERAWLTLERWCDPLRAATGERWSVEDVARVAILEAAQRELVARMVRA